MKIQTTIFTAALSALALGLPAFTGTALAAPKKVILVTTTTGFRHSSIPVAEQTLQKLAEESKAYEIVDSCRQPDVQLPKKPQKPRDLKPDADDKAKARYAADMKKFEAEMAKWTPEMEAQLQAAQGQFDAQMKESLAKLDPANLTAAGIDAVMFANTTGDLPLPDREGFIKWIEAGHAFIGMHSCSDTYHGFDLFKEMLQGEFAGHGPQVPADLNKADPKHPSTVGLPDLWSLKQEEMYLIKGHDRGKLRALYFMKHHPNNPEELGYFPVSWCRMAGKGHVFYTTLGHREDLWDASEDLKGRINPVEISKQFQQHILGGIQWALGLAPGSCEPNPEVK